MVLFTITSDKKEYKNYDMTNFIVDIDYNIYSENKNIGFIKRDDLTYDDLVDHFQNLKQEGFKITRYDYYV